MGIFETILNLIFTSSIVQAILDLFNGWFGGV